MKEKKDILNYQLSRLFAAQFNTLDKHKKRKSQEKKRKLSPAKFLEGEQIVSVKI